MQYVIYMMSFHNYKSWCHTECMPSLGPSCRTARTAWQLTLSYLWVLGSDEMTSYQVQPGLIAFPSIYTNAWKKICNKNVPSDVFLMLFLFQFRSFSCAFRLSKVTKHTFPTLCNWTGQCPWKGEQYFQKVKSKKRHCNFVRNVVATASGYSHITKRSCGF